jgi:hypothetical protein
MRVRISGSVEFMKEVEEAMAAADHANVEKSVRKLENAELQFGLQDVGDMIGWVKDLVELAPILWAAGVVFWKKLSGEAAPARAEAPGQLTIDITAPLKQFRVTITPTSTVEQIKEQLT